LRILLAEDEKDLSKALAAILKHEHYAVDAVYDGQDALDYGLSGNYDGVILDIMMPKMDGIEALRRLREAGVVTPVMMLTAKSQVADRIAGLDAGADDYLSKPFAMGEFLARVRALTRRGAEFTPCEMRFGDLTLNRATFELSRGAEAVRLGGKEFQMMEMLVRGQGRFIPTEEFMEHIWGCDSETELSVVWVYVSYLRRKLSGLGAKVQIVANRGRGYMLEERQGGEEAHD